MWHEANRDLGDAIGEKVVEAFNIPETIVYLPPPNLLVSSHVAKAVENQPIRNNGGIMLQQPAGSPSVNNRQATTYEARPGRGSKNV